MLNAKLADVLRARLGHDEISVLINSGTVELTIWNDVSIIDAEKERNLYAFVHNCATSSFDLYGLSEADKSESKIEQILEKIRERSENAQECLGILDQIKDAIDKAKAAGASVGDAIGGVLGINGIPAGVADALGAFIESSDCRKMLTCAKCKQRNECEENANGCALDLAIALSGDTSDSVGAISQSVFESVLNKAICTPRKQKPPTKRTPATGLSL